MVVLQFGFDPDDPHSPHRLENHASDRVVYTGTHDHDTARGWYSELDCSTARAVWTRARAVGVAEREPWWSLIRLALASPAAAGDGAGPGRARARDRGAHERPGAGRRRWRWRMEAGALTPALARRLREATEAAGRLVE